ncbi:MAG TPA: hypothetical protein VFH27_10605 [Longimicrobiaceae bacterium]|nr:hypothetical protein [Longimicrobiaceae bacterium]
MPPTAGPEPQRRLWPWVLVAVLLLASIALFFVYVPSDPSVRTPAAEFAHGGR